MKAAAVIFVPMLIISRGGEYRVNYYSCCLDANKYFLQVIRFSTIKLSLLYFYFPKEHYELQLCLMLFVRFSLCLAVHNSSEVFHLFQI